MLGNENKDTSRALLFQFLSLLFLSVSCEAAIFVEFAILNRRSAPLTGFRDWTHRFCVMQ